MSEYWRIIHRNYPVKAWHPAVRVLAVAAVAVWAAYAVVLFVK